MFGPKQDEINRLVKALGISSVSTVADVGAGKGDYAIPLSRIAGQVFAVEANPDRIATIQRKINKQNIQNLEPIQSSQSSCGLPLNSCDAAFLSNSYHHFTDPQNFNVSLFAALKPGANLLIIDFAPKWLLSLFSPVKGVPKNRGGHGIQKDILISEVTAAGFIFKQDLGAFSYRRYGILFKKPSGLPISIL